MRYVLVHGAATNSSVWDSTAARLRATGADVEVPDRPQSGSLDREIAFLAPLCRNAVVIGVSGGATLGLELAGRGVPMAAAWLHEPAVGSLAPGLLNHVATGLERDGIPGFGKALYGDAWHSSCTTESEATIRAEFAMFSGFEPKTLRLDAGRVVLTTGSCSPPERHASVKALADHLGVKTVRLAGTSHAAHLADAFDAEAIRALHSATDFATPSSHRQATENRR